MSNTNGGAGGAWVDPEGPSVREPAQSDTVLEDLRKVRGLLNKAIAGARSADRPQAAKPDSKAVGRCRTCRWWGTPRITSGYHECGWVGAGSLGEGGDGWALDDEDRCGTFVTGPDFGCVNHEPTDRPKVAEGGVS